MQNGFSSVGYSIAAHAPNYPPPEASSLVSSNIHGSSIFTTTNPPVYTSVSHDAAVVSQKPRMNGMRTLYNRGARYIEWFRMIATGASESTSFQPTLCYTWAETGFNDALYAAGYPQNLGLSEKVPSVPEGVRTSAAWGRMSSAPRFSRNVFANRSYSTAPSVPAIPSPGRSG